MATIALGQAVFYGNPQEATNYLRGGAEHPLVKETASQTYAAGAPVYYDSNGTIAVATASSNVVAQLAGFAIAKATGTTGASVTYRPIKARDRYVMNCTNAGSAAATALTQIGDTYNVDVVTGYLVVNVNATTADGTKIMVKVIDIYTVLGGYADGDVLTDTGGRLVVEFLDQPGLQG